MYSYAKRFSKTVHQPLNWNLKTWKVPSSKLFRWRRFSFQLLEISPRPGTRAPLSAFVSFAHVHVHTIPVELHPPCPRHAHTFSKSQLTSPLYSESPSPRERNTVENLTNFSFRSCIPIALTPLLLGSFQTERYRPFTSSIPFILSSAFQTNWKRWNPRL